VFSAACGQPPASNEQRSANTFSTVPGKFTPADIAKLKWIEGTWRGMDGDQPFFERYKIDDSTIIVETFEDDTLSKVTDTTRFELKNGEFGAHEGDKRSVASLITDNAVQFVPAVAGKRNSFRFERTSNDSWNAVLEWPAAGDQSARSKVYKMERWAGTR
jgi:hypothetical protein